MYTLRPATEDDFDFLFDLHEVAMRDHVQAIWGWDDAFQRKMYRESFANKQRSIVIVDGVESGVVCILRRAGDVYLELVEIHPRLQRRGVGSAIVRAVLAEAAAARLPAALRVFKINVGARRLYQRLGFVIVGENETHYDMRCG
ncbi:MAG TPA: GNAT family N-acetyltransferase [Polyangia bacterium]|jgi:ribosomal protein S18 acetylase RimI-like enzyme